MELLLNNDVFEDDLEVLELVEVGIPRRIYVRSELFYNLDELAFYKRFRLTKNTVVNVLDEIEQFLEYPNNMNNSVSPLNQVLLTLRFYATGKHLLSVADFAGVHVSTASRIVAKVTNVIAQLRPRYVKFPATPAGRDDLKLGFLHIAQFPRVIGAVDGTHIKIQSPGGNDAEVFRNRKQYFSINVQVISSYDGKMLDVVARWPGSAHDATIFNNSNIRGKFENGHFPNCLLLGDSGYGIRSYLFTPLLNPATPAEQLYNEAQIRTRGVVEKMIGVWKRRFPVLAYGCRLKLSTLLRTIVATAVLHNIAHDMGDLDAPPDEEVHVNMENVIINGRIDVNPQGDQGNGAVHRRELIEDYFQNLIDNVA